MQLNINGAPVEVSGGASDLLLWVLRDELGMIGTRFGCGAGICGACTVHVDGVATRSCITPLALVQDKQIRTIEGMATTAEDGTLVLHPLQQAFIDVQVPQCAWCMSGQIMTAAAFLAQNPAPSEDEIVAAMGNNYCRCGCYARIKRAVAQAAQQMVASNLEEVAA
ncbi:MAG: (2Fe-2S)-binding protein [Caldilineaceae bacterium]